MKLGRRAILEEHPELIEVIVGYLKRGHTIEGICNIIGIDDSTYFRWQDKGKDDDAAPIYKEFCDATRAAMGYWELAQIERIKDAKWLLTHNPSTKDRWAEYKREEITTHEGAKIDVKAELEKNLKLLDEQEGVSTTTE